jgi:hypothetical protein
MGHEGALVQSPRLALHKSYVFHTTL